MLGNQFANLLNIQAEFLGEIAKLVFFIPRHAVAVSETRLCLVVGDGCYSLREEQRILINVPEPIQRMLIESRVLGRSCV